MKNRTDRRQLARLLGPAGLLLAASAAWAQCTPDTILAGAGLYLVGDNPLEMTAGDVNGDGFADVVAGNYFGESVSILYSDGTGQFGGHVELPLIVDPEADLLARATDPVIADLNGDGLSDIIVGVESADLGFPGVAVFMQQAGGTFADPEFYGFAERARGVRVAHMNGDAFLDIVYVNRDDNSLNVLPGNGDGTFEQELFTLHDAGPTGTVIADFNGDGTLDVAMTLTLATPKAVAIAFNDGTGNLTEGPQRYEVPAAENLRGGDLNGDGRMDLVIRESFAVHFLLGNADGTFQAAQRVSMSFSSCADVADVNGDGFADIVNGRNIGGAVGVLMSNGDGTFVEGANIPAGGTPRSLALGDFNNDGAIDVAAGIVTADQISILLNQCVETAPVCACETDGDAAQVDVFDLLAYLDLWFAGDAAAELTGDEPVSVDVFDLLAFLDCWFPASAGSACP